jgi:hypothetical protein
MAYLDTNGAGTSCIVDFAKTASIDGSALYMLLLLYDYAGGGQLTLQYLMLRGL